MKVANEPDSKSPCPPHLLGLPFSSTLTTIKKIKILNEKSFILKINI